MTFDQIANLSNTDYRVLVQLDLSKLNLQWTNAGAGIWYVNFSATYPEVDSSLLDGFTAQTFGNIGSVRVDSTQYVKVDTLALVSTTEISFYYDSTNEEVYIHFVNNDEPFIHDIFLGVIQGFSYDEFTPIDSDILYQGRLIGDINLGESRDPLYFGKIKYNVGGITLLNTDGYFDTYPIDNDFYGNAIRVFIGFNQISVNNYIKVFSGLIETVSVNEDDFKISILDRRKTLSKSVTYTCTTKNALEAVRELLYLHYGAIYNSTYYDTVAWASAESVVSTISVDIQTGKAITDIPVIKLIEDVCASVFGLFIITPEDKYSFKIVDTSATASTTIQDIDIINRHEIEYNPTEVISSAKVGYAKNWNEGFTSPYTWYYDTTYENAVFLKYKVYNQKEFTTLLDTLAQATSFANTMLLYTKDIHGIGVVNAPFKYYGVEVGDIVNIEINRDTSTMLGTKKCEIISRKRSLKSGFIQLGYRII